MAEHALSDCVNWEMNPLGDCSGRITTWGISGAKILLCETCLNRRPVTESLSVPAEIHGLYMDGFADEEFGNVDSPYGHGYRIGAAIVVTDTLGFSQYAEYASEHHARLAFHAGQAAFDAWEAREGV